MKTHKKYCCRAVAVRNYKYHIMQITLYTCIAIMAFFAKETVALFTRALISVFNMGSAGTTQFVAKLIYVMFFIAVLTIIESFFRRKILDYETTDD